MRDRNRRCRNSRVGQGESQSDQIDAFIALIECNLWLVWIWSLFIRAIWRWSADAQLFCLTLYLTGTAFPIINNTTLVSNPNLFRFLCVYSLVFVFCTLSIFCSLSLLMAFFIVNNLFVFCRSIKLNLLIYQLLTFTTKEAMNYKPFKGALLC